MRAYWKQPIGNALVKPRGLIPSLSIIFPLRHPAAAKFSGVTEEKIQFFSSAYTVANEEGLAALITNPHYSGNILFLSPDRNAPAENARSWSKNLDLSENARLTLAYQVLRFDANRLRLSIHVPEKPTWMFYSDVWHPSWKATINGHKIPIYKANLAYKAILLKKGPNDVWLRFGSPWVVALYWGLGTFSFFWLILPVWMVLGSKPTKNPY